MPADTLPHDLLHATATGSAPLLHARLLLPPLLGWHDDRYSGARLQRIDDSAARQLAGVHDVLQRGHLVALLAASDDVARSARHLLRAAWSQAAQDRTLPRSRQRRSLFARGAVDKTSADRQLSAHYQWQAAATAHGMRGMVALAAPTEASGLRIDLPFGNARALTLALASLLQLPVDKIEVRVHRAPQSAQEVADAADAAGVAALLCQHAQAPVSLVLDTSAALPPATHLHLDASLDHGGAPQRYALEIDQPATPPPLAWLLTETAFPIDDAAAAPMLAPPYAWPVIDIGSIGASDQVALAAATFAQESFLDELARSGQQDPVQYRLAHLPDPHGAQLIRSVADAAGWRTQGAPNDAVGQVLRGRGFAYAATIEHEQGAPLQTWSAWVADVEYDKATGELSVTRVTAGHDASATVAADSDNTAPRELLNQQARLAMQQVVVPGTGFDDWARDQSLAVSAPAAALPAVDVVGQLPAVDFSNVQLKAGAAFTLPAAAAVANAIHDATGVRLRSAPFSGEQVRLALGEQQQPRGWRRLRKYGWLGGAVAALGATLTLAMPWRGAIAPIAPIARPAADLYSAATIERGRLVALAGDCAVCHTAPNGGVANAGGHALQTPFGTIYSTNITPDEKTGIGNWSYAAFERAMREGIHRDGRQLYPAFPYTAFAKISDADLQALYGYLMAQPAVSSTPPANTLRFPFNMRPLLAGWNLLNHKAEPFQPDPKQSALWNRGAYLVEGAGHCSACHSPRDFMGAEKGGRHYLTGGSVDGWEAPALTAHSKAPIAWTEDELFTYLRTGFSSRHGIAAGPMAPVVAELAQLPAQDVRAMAHYLASLHQPAASANQPLAAVAATPVAPAAPATSTINTISATQQASLNNGKRLFQGACAACHQEGTGPTLFGVRPSLRVNTNVHSDSPDNLVHVILHGIRQPANPDLGYMPGFANSFSDSQMTDLLNYLRSSFAPDKPAWRNLPDSVARSRLQQGEDSHR